MTLTITLPGRVYAAVQTIAADKTDPRHYLRGVRLRVDGTGGAMIEASDGDAAIRYYLPRQAPGDGVDVIIPPIAVKETAPVTLEVSACGPDSSWRIGSAIINLSQGDHAEVLQNVPGHYPDTDRLYQDATTQSGGPAPRLSLQLMSRVTAALSQIALAHGYKQSSLVLTLNGPGRSAGLSILELPEVHALISV